MSNHFHLVVPMLPAEANAWSAQQVAERWCRLFPKKKPEEHQAKIEAIAANTANVAIYRERLHDLSWLMKMISEPIARRARRLVAKAGAFGPHYLKLFSRLIAACLDTAQKRPDANHTALNIRSRQTLKQTLSPLR